MECGKTTQEVLKYVTASEKLTERKSQLKIIAPSNGRNTSCWKMNLLSSHTEDVIIILSLREHFLHKTPYFSCQEHNYPFQAKNCRESTTALNQNETTSINLQARDWPDTTQQYCHSYTRHYFQVCDVELFCNFIHIKPVVPKPKTQDRAKTDGEAHWNKIASYKFRNLEIMASIQFLFIR